MSQVTHLINGEISTTITKTRNTVGFLFLKTKRRGKHKEDMKARKQEIKQRKWSQTCLNDR